MPQDLEKAIYWYTKLAESGRAEAMCVLGRYYELGRGVAPDMEKSVHWHIKAAEHGWLPSLTILRRLSENGDAKAGEALRWLDVSDRTPLPSEDKDMWVYADDDHQHGQCQVYICSDTIRYGASGDHGCYGTASAKSVDRDGNLVYEHEYRFAWSYDKERYPLWFYHEWRNGYHVIHGTSLTNLQAEAVLVYMLEHDPNPEARQIPLDGWSVNRNGQKC